MHYVDVLMHIDLGVLGQMQIKSNKRQEISSANCVGAQILLSYITLCLYLQAAIIQMKI